MLEFRRVLFRSEEHTSELQSHDNLVCRLLLEKRSMTALMPVLVAEQPPAAEASAGRAPEVAAVAVHSRPRRAREGLGRSFRPFCFFLKTAAPPSPAPFPRRHPIRG